MIWWNFLKCLAPKRRKINRSYLFKYSQSWEAASVCGDWNNGQPLCWPLSNQKQQLVIRPHHLNFWRTRLLLITLGPKGCARNPDYSPCSCLLPGWGIGMVSATMWKLILTEIDQTPWQTLPLLLQVFYQTPEFQNSGFKRFCYFSCFCK